MSVHEGELKRVSHVPDEDDDTGTLIAGQEWDNVEFGGGTASNMVLTDVVINGETTVQTIRVITSGNPINQIGGDRIVEFNKTPAGASSFVLNPSFGTVVTVKDVKGDAAVNPITVTDTLSRQIDDAANFVINQAYGAATFGFNGSEWNVLNNYINNLDEIEGAQDAVGSIFDATLVYNDATPSMGRAAIAGDVTIPSGSNTAAITSNVIVNADINSAAAIDASKIANGTVSNTEFQYLDGVTSGIQTQIGTKNPNIQFQDEGSSAGALGGINTVNFVGSAVTAMATGSTLTVTVTGGSGGGDVAGPASATDNALSRFDGTTGKIIQNSAAILDDAGNLTATSFIGPLTGNADTVTTNANLSGDVTSVGNLTSITTNAVIDSDLRQSVGLSVIGNAASTTANVGDITALADNQILRRNGTSIGFGSINLTAAASTSGVLRVDRGSTGQSAVVTGDLLYGSATDTWSRLAGVATGNALISGGVGVAPAWGKIGLTTHITGILAGTNGGTGVNNATRTMTYAGNISFAGAFTQTFTATANSSVTIPTTGTLATLAGVETLTNKTINTGNNTVTGTNASSSTYLRGDGVWATPSSAVATAAVPTTSGTAIDFTSIPAGVRRITVSPSGMSTSGTSEVILQLGATGIETTGYLGSATLIGTSTLSNVSSATSGIQLTRGNAAVIAVTGQVFLTLVDSTTNTWSISYSLIRTDSNGMFIGGGAKSLTGVLSSLRLTTVAGTDTFDAGKVSIIYEVF